MSAALNTITASFQGQDILLADKDGEPYVAMKAITEGIGIDWEGQRQRIQKDPKRWGTCVMQAPSISGEQDTLFMPLRKLPGWLMTLQPSRVAHKKSATIIRIYQEECDNVLWDYWTKGHVENPRMVAEQHSLIEQGNYPTEWKQDAPHKLEQARACSKGSYELLKRFVPTMEAIRAELAMLPDLGPQQQEQLTHEVVYLKERMSHLMGQFAGFDQVIRQHLTVPQVIHAPLKRVYESLGAVADLLERRGDAGPEALLVRQNFEQIAAILPPPDRTPTVAPEVSLAGKMLARAPRHPRSNA